MEERNQKSTRTNYRYFVSYTYGNGGRYFYDTVVETQSSVDNVRAIEDLKQYIQDTEVVDNISIINYKLIKMWEE